MVIAGLAVAAGLVTAFHPGMRRRRMLKRYPNGGSLTVRVSEDFDRVYVTPVDAAPGQGFRVNPFRMTCSCDQFRNDLVDIPQGRSERLCPHLVRVMVEERCLAPGPLAAALANPSPHKTFFRAGSEVIFAYTVGMPLVDVYTEAEPHADEAVNHYARYCYSLSARRWRRLRIPPQKVEIESLIAQHFS